MDRWGYQFLTTMGPLRTFTLSPMTAKPRGVPDRKGVTLGENSKDEKDALGHLSSDGLKSQAIAM
jgi:hypothetical protein